MLNIKSKKSYHADYVSTRGRRVFIFLTTLRIMFLIFVFIFSNGSDCDLKTTLTGIATGIKVLNCDDVRDSKHIFINDYPKARENGWSDDLQGVTHDESNWYITQTKTLWKFPVDQNLNNKVTKADPSKGILKCSIPKELKKLGYNHFGDLEYYEENLFVPMTGGAIPIIALFKARNLEFIGSAALDLQNSAGWCAINPGNGFLYTSNSTISANQPIYYYKPIVDSESTTPVMLNYEGSNQILDSSGQPMTLNSPQGGVFSEFGCLLYLVNGYLEEVAGPTGIHVFDQDFIKVSHSTNGSGEFNFEFHPAAKGCGDFTWGAEEPEGITIWDLDDGRAPGISGQLHVIMISNELEQDWWIFDSHDDFYFKHYKIEDPT